MKGYRGDLDQFAESMRVNATGMFDLCREMTDLLIARNGGGANETFTVRRISFGEGVERVFPLHSPYVAKVEVERSGATRRAKLYYMRKLTSKQSRLKEVQD
jgi:ribosomal protein L19